MQTLPLSRLVIGNVSKDDGIVFLPSTELLLFSIVLWSKVAEIPSSRLVLSEHCLIHTQFHKQLLYMYMYMHLTVYSEEKGLVS